MLNALAGRGWVSRRLTSTAARQGRSLVLLYHDIGDESKGEVESVVARVPGDLLAAHIAVLRDIGEVVPLEDLLRRNVGENPRFAITFDDDSASYASDALPVLRRANVSATFFLSGRSLAGLRPYWWDVLDWWLRERGLDETSRALGAPPMRPRALAAWCEQRPDAIDVLYAGAPAHAAVERLLDADSIARLASSGMEVGFHTLHHPVLTDLADDALERAMVEGREALEAVTGRTVRYLSCPHGRTDSRVAAAAGRAGYEAAFGSRGRPVGPASPRLMLDRWEPGPIEPDRLRGEIVWRLLRRPA